jgi:hypothetical protein
VIHISIDYLYATDQVNGLYDHDEVWLNGTRIEDHNPLNVTMARCFDGKQLNWTLNQSEETFYQCVQNNGYSWGFSVYSSSVATGCMILWSWVMFIIWCDANFKGKLNRHGWKRRGVFRSALDLAEAIRFDVGSTAGSYTNKEIEKVLKNKKTVIGYSTARQEDGSLHIRLSSTSNAKVELKEDNYYS